ncbi:hybrid sensor histidine kinase/response regulator [Pleurocapsa sp. PCC 7319]|uniref:sensor histidine kinase n=1 Tax=Pleurocapsa sp. PCC 7319 TaxID=118161 RepID=UPI00034B1882|nr:hybrid sensor histidine kinase/response regulator [Pleurocapsa sp. PCC 7319]
MPFKTLGRKIGKSYRNLSLQNIITIPFLLHIFLTVGLVGYLSWRNGEQAVNNVTRKLRSEVTAGVEKHLENYLAIPHIIVRLKQNAIKLKKISIADFSDAQQDFWSTIQLFDSVRAIYMGNQAGKFIYLKQEDGKFYTKEVTKVPERKTYSLDRLGQKQKLLEVDEFDLRQRPWYINTQLTQENNWSKIYTFTGGELGITAAGFLRDSQGDTQGIVGVDLILSGIGNFLQKIEISENGQIFILERNGYLVATSSNEKPFIYDSVERKEKRLRAIDSQNLLIKATSEYITQHFRSLYNIDRPEQLDFRLKSDSPQDKLGSITTLSTRGDRQLVQVLPYQDELGLDWLIVVVIPEADFMAEINANTRNTILLCLLALVIATLFGIYTSRRIAQPIAHLSQVTNLVAQSAQARKAGTDFYPVVQAKSIRELKLLAQSFNEMVLQLKAAFKDLENTNEKLENRVKQRTEALKIAKEAADAANRAKSEFLANMSHELRTPLHAILGFTQVFLQDSQLNPQQKENLATVKRSGEHLLVLINNILEMSKIESGAVSVTEKPFDLHLLLENLAKMFKLRLDAPPRRGRLPAGYDSRLDSVQAPRLGSAHRQRRLDSVQAPRLGSAHRQRRSQNTSLELIFDLASNLPQYIQTDPVKLHQILSSLIENGIKYTEKGRVTLKVEPIIDRSSASGQPMAKSSFRGMSSANMPPKNPTPNISKLVFTVEDTGDGILASELESIFAPFTQTKQAIAQEGTGLGLAISQNFVRLLGGEINVSSTVGQGAKFEFQIPIKVVDRSQLETNSTAQELIDKIDSLFLKQDQEQNVASQKYLPPAIDISVLASMPAEWLANLRQAAIEVDADMIEQLIEQIDSSNIYLAQELTRMLNNFEYDEIMELTELADNH